MKTFPKLLVPIFLLVSTLPIGLAAQTLLDRYAPPEISRSAFGESNALSGDFNRDGILDLVVVDRTDFSTSTVRIYSGADHSGILSNISFTFNYRKLTVASGDVTGDGVADLVVGVPDASAEISIPNQTDPETIYGAGVVYIYSGANGAQISATNGTYSDAGYGAAINVQDLNGDGKAEVLIASSHPSSSASPDLFVLQGGTITLRCVFGTDPSKFQSAMTAPTAGPDLNKDGWREILVGFPELPNGSDVNAGAIYVVDGKTCSAQILTAGDTSNVKLGEYIFPTVDFNADGIQDISISYSDQMAEILSGKDLSAISALVGPSDPTLLPTSPLIPLSDLQGDGAPDYAMAFYYKPAEGDTANLLLIFSGKDRSIIGILPMGLFTKTSSDADGSSFSPQLITSPRYDLDHDGKSEIIIITSLDRNNDAVVNVLAGSCPVEVSTSILNPQDNIVAPIGPITVKATSQACGVDLEGQHELRVNGQVVSQLFDAGQNGDESASDNVFSGIYNLPKGEVTLEVVSNVFNGVPLSGSAKSKVRATENYSVARVPYEWNAVDLATPLGISTSSLAAQVNIPFPLIYYGRPFTKATITGIGLIYLENGSETVQPQPALISERMPSQTLGQSVLAPLWGSVIPVTASRVYTQILGTPGSQRYVVTFEGFEFKPDDNSQNEASRLDFQIVLSEGTNRIRVNYKRVFSTSVVKNSGAASTVGIQGSPLLGLTFSHREGIITDGSSLEFIPPGQVTVTPTPPNNTPTNPPTATEVPGLTFKVGFSKKGLNLNLASLKQGTATPYDITALSSCEYFIHGGQGNNAAGVKYRQLGKVAAGTGARALFLKGFTDTVKKEPTKKGKKAAATFLRAQLRCAPSAVDVYSAPAQLKTSSAKGAISGKQWLSRFASKLAKVK